MTTTRTARAEAFLDELNHAYEALHTAKEDAFWTAYMGLASDADRARAELDEREIELARFLRDPARLARVRDEIAAAEARIDDPDADRRPSEEALVSLSGWLSTFEAHVIESASARALAE